MESQPQNAELGIILKTFTHANKGADQPAHTCTDSTFVICSLEGIITKLVECKI